MVDPQVPWKAYSKSHDIGKNMALHIGHMEYSIFHCTLHVLYVWKHLVMSWNKGEKTLRHKMPKW